MANDNSDILALLGDISKTDGVKREVSESRQDVQQVDQRLERVEKGLPTYEDVIRRLTVLENIVLNKAS